MKYYIRFGVWPKDERSHIGDGFRRSRAWVYTSIGEDQPEYEEGVSVYSADWDQTKKRWVIPTLGSDSYLASLDELINRKVDIYLVTGDELSDCGSDGEPLLRSLKLVKKLEYSDIYNEDVYDYDAIISNETSPIKPLQVNYLLKKPGQNPKLLKGILGGENIRKQLGGYFQMHSVLPGIVILVLELDDPTQARFNLFWPSLGPIKGPLIITALRSQIEIIKFHQKYPWPWNIALENEETPGPEGEEFRSLSKAEFKAIIKFIKRITIK